MSLVNVLVVDDDPSTRGIVSCYLQILDMDVKEAEDGLDALEKISQEIPDVILLDLDMPKMDGFTLCQKLQENPRLKATYIIILSATSDIEQKVKAFEIGAHDYLVKPFHPAELKARVQVGARTVNALKNTVIDDLTQAYTRNFFLSYYQHEQIRCYREKIPFCVVFIDIDHFKNVNDTYGHKMGDKALCHFSQEILKGIRRSDIFARWGGDEFILFLPSTKKEGAEILCRRLQQRVRNLKVGPKEVSITASFGITDKLSEGIDLIQVADDSLYKAKERGRDCIYTRAPLK